MTDLESSPVLNRLRAVEWMGDWNYAFEHVMSRRILMREYIRRAAVWARAYSAESEWPFFDVTQYLAPEFQLPPEINAQLEECLSHVPSEAISRTCVGAVRLEKFYAQSPGEVTDLPDLYAPLILFYERGGEFIRDNAGFLDLTGVLLRPGPLHGHLGSLPLTSLSEAVLDAVDVEGRVSYYTSADRQGPLLRHRKLRDGQHNELFSRNLRWEATDATLSSEAEAKDADLVRLDEIEAANLIALMVTNASR